MCARDIKWHLRFQKKSRSAFMRSDRYGRLSFLFHLSTKKNNLPENRTILKPVPDFTGLQCTEDLEVDIFLMASDTGPLGSLIGI